MAYEFKLPDIGEGTAEGEIVQWLVSEGDQVEEDQPIVEVMTDKATVEIPSPRAGEILRLGAQEGEILEVGEILVVFGEPGEELDTEAEAEAVEEPEAAPEPGGAAAAEREPGARKSEEGGEPEIDEARARAVAERRAAEDETADEAEPSEGEAAERRPWEAPAPREGRVLATPATRKLARELDVDLSRVRGSGDDGRVMKEDVRAAAEGVAASAVEEPEEPEEVPEPAPRRPAAEPGEREERVALRGMRRRIAEQMTASKANIPHFTYVEEVDMTEVVKLREEAKPLAEERGVKLTYLPFIIKALIPALKSHPGLNASLDDENEEIVYKHYYNIGIATDTDRGLMVPVVRDADQRGVFELAAEIRRLADAARGGRIQLDDLQGGTFTITSTGNLGGVLATPIINPPETGILGVTAIRKRPMVVDDEIVPRHMMFLSLSLDHRVVDGAVAARFMNELVRYLEDPKLLLLEAL